jgi:hypothetical protein
MFRKQLIAAQLTNNFPAFTELGGSFPRQHKFKMRLPSEQEESALHTPYLSKKHLNNSDGQKCITK